MICTKMTHTLESVTSDIQKSSETLHPIAARNTASERDTNVHDALHRTRASAKHLHSHLSSLVGSSQVSL
jgi:hypothetical protein